jgi:hypothetical protein
VTNSISKLVQCTKIKVSNFLTRYGKCLTHSFLSGIVLDEWSVNDVAAWLDDQNLGQYGEGFAANEITGPVLLDLSLEDLDYMGMSALGEHVRFLSRLVVTTAQDTEKSF